MTHRLKIADALHEHPWCSTIELVGRTGLSRGTISNELTAMESDGIVQRRLDENSMGAKGGNFRYLFAMSEDVIAKQGHVYRHGEKRVLALESGRRIKVAEIAESDEFWPVRSHYECNANALRPLPMRYFHGQTPS